MKSYDFNYWCSIINSLILVFGLMILIHIKGKQKFKQGKTKK